MKDKIILKIKTIKPKHNDCEGCMFKDTVCSVMVPVFKELDLPDCRVENIIYKVVEDDKQ